MSKKRNETKIAGITIGVSGAIMILAMMHHPVIDSHSPEEIAQEVLSEQTINQTVHGAMIGLALVALYGVSVVKHQLGAWARFGWIFYMVGAISFVGAALISGFATPELVSIYGSAPSETLKDQLKLLYALNQSLSEFGSLMTGLGMFGISIGLLSKNGFGRIAGIAGILCGLAITILILFGWSLNVPGMTLIVCLMALWFGLTGIWLFRDA